jgi:hypothetical protein
MVSEEAPERELQAPVPTATYQAPTSVKDAYAVFRRAATRADRLPSSKRGDIVRRIAGTPTQNVYLVLRGRSLCSVTTTKSNRAGGMGCGPAETYLDGHTPIGSFSDEDGPSTITSAFPDGVREVTLTLADGSSRTYPVENNGFARDVPARPAKLAWIAPDGSAQAHEYHAAPAFRAADFYSVLKRPERPGDALDGLPGARRLLQDGEAVAWLVPRDGAVCLVLEVKDARASGCRHKVADVRFPLVVALPSEPERIVAAAFPDAAERISVLPAITPRRAQNALLITRGETARALRWKISSPDPPRTETLPAGEDGFVLHARDERPESLPEAQGP